MITGNNKKVGTVSAVPAFIDPVFLKTSPKLVYKFGHRAARNLMSNSL
jgi:hypothetical protein